jgi:membrane fusion protein (multidrug efflux system)
VFALVRAVISMPTAFSRTLRSLENDRLRWSWRVALFGVALIAAWSTWFALARVSTYAASSQARVVVDHAVYPIVSEVDGRVVALHAGLDDRVEQGDVLLELDPSHEKLELDEERQRAASATAESHRARQEIEALERGLDQMNQAGEKGLREAELEKQRLELARKIAVIEADRLASLRDSGNASELTVLKARAEADKADLSMQSQDVAIERIRLEQSRGASDRQAALASLRRTLEKSEGEIAISKAAVARLEHDIERRKVRAPAAGVVGEIAALSAGSHVRAGDRMGAVVSPGVLKVDARFAPAAVLGRVQVGDVGVLRLAGFPWLEYGAPEVVVERIASEARDGEIQVELAFVDAMRSKIPLEHGLPGSVEIRVGRSSPAELVLASVGKLFGSRDAKSPAPPLAQPAGGR